MKAKALRMATIAPILLALITLAQPLFPAHSSIAELFNVTDATAAFGLTLLVMAIVWFLYIAGHRYARQLMLWSGAFLLLSILLVLAGYIFHFRFPLEHYLVPASKGPFLINLTYMLLACFIIQVLIYWLPRTKFAVNSLLAIILFMAILSSFGHIYSFHGFQQDSLLLPMPFGEIIYFLVLGLIIFGHTNQMDRLYLNSKLVLSFTTMFVAVIGANIVIYENVNRALNVSGAVEILREVSQETYNVGYYLGGAQSAVSAYEVSGSTQYITTFQNDKQAYLATITILENSSAAGDVTGSAKQSIASLANLGNHVLSIGDSAVATTQPQSLPLATRASINQTLYADMTQVQSTVKSINNTYSNKLNQFADQEYSGGRGIILGVSTTSALSLLLIIFTPLFVRETIQKLSMTRDSLRKSNHLLYDEKSRAEAVLASISDGLFAVDINKAITIFNEAAEEMTGLRRIDVLGKRYDEVTRFRSVADENKSLDFTEKALQGVTHHLTHNVKLLRANGQKLDVQVSASPIRSVSGLVQGAIIVFRDRSSEQELENAKDEFVSLASHQLRTPATATKQFLAMFLQGYAGKIDARQRLFLQEAYDNNEMGIKFIEDLLNITRLENNKLRVVKETIEVASFLRSIITQHEAVATRDRQTIELDAPAKPIYIESESNLLHMMMDNLISNALKYSNEGGKITVRLTDGGKVRIAVIDHGIGMKQEDIPKIFERFTRLEDPQKQYVGGTGIGLYLVKKIAKRLHATIHVESVYGKGSTFTLTFRPRE